MKRLFALVFIALPAFAAAYSVSGPLVASNGTGFVAIWYADTLTANHVFATFADASGRPVKTLEIPLLPQSIIAVDGKYLVQSGSFFYELSESGEIKQRFWLPGVSTVVSNGHTILVITIRGGAGCCGPSDVTLADANGNTIRSVATLNDANWSRAIPAGDDYVVWWSNGTTIRISPEGDVLSTIGPNLPAFPIAAPNGDLLLITSTGQPLDIEAMLMRHDGSVTRQPIPLDNAFAFSGIAGVASSAGYVMTAWIADRNGSYRKLAMTFDADAHLISTAPMISPDLTSFASNGTILFGGGSRATPKANNVFTVAIDPVSLTPIRTDEISLVLNPRRRSAQH